MAVEPRTAEQTAKEVKRDVDSGKLNEGNEALRHGYLDWMKSGKDEGQFWSTLKTTGGLTDADMQHLSLAFARSNFEAMSDRSWTTGNKYIDGNSLGRFDGDLRNGGSTPESKYAQAMDQYLQKALDSDPSFHHAWYGLGMETNLHGTGNYIFKDTLDERIAQINTEDRGRAIAGDTARALDAKGADGRTLFDRMANGQPSLTPDAIRKAGDNLGAYSPQEQAVIKNMIKGMDDSSSAEGIAMSQLQDSNKDYGITRDKLNTIEKDPAFQPADAPQETQPKPGQLTADVAKNGIDAIAETKSMDKLLNKDKQFTRDAVDAYLKDQNNHMSINQRQALEKLRDGLPQDGKGVSPADLVAAAGFKKADGTADGDKLNQHLADLRNDGTGTLDAMHNNIDGSKIKDDKGNITPESIAKRMKDIQDEAAKSNGGPVSGNHEYAALQRMQQHFNDISSDGKTITSADLDQYAKSNGQDKFAGFKEGGQPHPEPQPQPQPEKPQIDPAKVKEDGDKLTADQTVKLGRGPIYDQAMHILQERAKATGEQVTPQAARQLLEDMAKLNHWPGSDAQWAAYVKDGSPRHLPRTLNYAMRSGMDMHVPGSNPTNESIARTAQDRVPPPNLQLTPEQIKEVKDKVPNVANLPDTVINSYVLSKPDVLGDHLTADQKAAATQWRAQYAAYIQALQEYIASKRNPST